MTHRTSLIGQAFGGDNPRIKLNKLQTDSERDMQKGIQEVLRGVYTAIRNPRSHDSMKDEKFDSDAIIVFISYLLKLIDKSKLSFDENDFLGRICDPYYVKTKEYSDLLVDEIPKRKRASIAILAIKRRNDVDIYSLGHFLGSLLGKLEDSEVSRVFNVISDELRTTVLEHDIKYLVHISPGKYWAKIDKAVRIRIDSLLFKDFANASYDAMNDIFGKHGALSTWVTTEHLKNFDELGKWTGTLVSMLTSGDNNLMSYINKYYWKKMCLANKSTITWPLKQYFATALENSERDIIDKLKSELIWEENHPWWNVFKQELMQYPDIKYQDLPF